MKDMFNQSIKEGDTLIYATIHDRVKIKYRLIECIGFTNAAIKIKFLDSYSNKVSWKSPHLCIKLTENQIEQGMKND